MGPLETADLIGLDTVLHSLNVLYENIKIQSLDVVHYLKRWWMQVNVVERVVKVFTLIKIKNYK